ncbi:hypothetical protein [Photobacterium satsumensis]|uniref:hypothetical protein n=1 Tax=Photobacterium satsumensis TaxID=2910239 RepID=UPI003D110FE6
MKKKAKGMRNSLIGGDFYDLGEAPERGGTDPTQARGIFLAWRIPLLSIGPRNHRLLTVHLLSWLHNLPIIKGIKITN